MSLTLVVDPAVVPDYPGLAATLGVPAVQTFNGPATPLGHSIPASGYFIVQRCNGSTTFTDGPLTPQQVAAIPACTADANAATLQAKAPAALVANAAFLAIASPTQAQAIAQTKALTRQVDALIRLANGILDSVADS